MKASLSCVILALTFGACNKDTTTSPSSTSPMPIQIVDQAGAVNSGFEILVNTDLGRTDWLSKVADGLLAAYPSSQQFGFIAAVLSGPTTLGSRPGKDVSAFKTLQLQLRGAVGGESVDVGIKDNTDPDDGTEIKKTLILTSSFQSFSMPLADFSTADLTRVYLLCELVFNGPTGRSVFVRDVRYVP